MQARKRPKRKVDLNIVDAPLGVHEFKVCFFRLNCKIQCIVLLKAIKTLKVKVTLDQVFSGILKNHYC